MDDQIGVKIDGVIYVKLDDVKPMRYRIEQLEASLRTRMKGCWLCLGTGDYWDGEKVSVCRYCDDFVAALAGKKKK